MKTNKLIQECLTELQSSKDYYESIKLILNKKEVSKKLIVEFSLYCVKDALVHLDSKKYPKEYEKVKACLELVGKWLAAPGEVSKKELEEAANEAYAAAYAASNAAAYAAANAAAYAANAAYAAAYYAANAANAAAYAAANAANAAAYAAANAAAGERAAKQKEYLIYLIKLILKEFNYDTKTFTVLFENTSI